MSEKKQEIAERLLDGLLDHLCERLTPAQLEGVITQELDYLLAQSDRFSLSQLVSVEQVQTTARKYAVQMDISGAIPELVGDMVERFYDHGIQGQRQIGEVLDESAVEAFLDKLLEIPLSQHGVAWLGRNPVLLAVLAGGAQMGVKTVLHQSLPAPLRAQLLKRLPPRWLASLELRLQEWLLRRTEQLLSDPYLYRDDNLEELRDLVLVAWQDFAQRPVAELRELISSEDIQELFVIVFEYWRELRHSDYFNSLLDTGVQAFFDKYGDSTPGELLAELGISREMMLDDALRFAPPILAVLQREGLVREWLRRQLGPYFASESALAILEEGL
ncbi:hypothetical protein A11A3_07875 [Alcanivorax hongdengensis A-11-3]|uniref:Uncharacterized protein n=1 Tax=Alcanivorax hongdengensis A-11-3 TaxID=1177179 RepID=L0WCQ8_9GAMM|nr:hypothetical protein [Alcanivorax hongdengensis]EKF74528.1 hypothetical protein A11A3_07875 [Alcanivorax hongdengensis A-11-3]